MRSPCLLSHHMTPIGVSRMAASSLCATSNEKAAILSNSSFSLSYIDTFNQTSLQGLSTVTQTANEIPGTGWMELTTWPKPSIVHVQFFNSEVFQKGRFMCSRGGVYYCGCEYFMF